MAKTEKTTPRRSQVSIDRICKTCALYEPASGYCKKTNEQTPGLRYACSWYNTPEEWKAECEARRQARLQKEEQRLNFLLTALYISTTASIQLLEYFDTQFKDKRAEADWRFSRKRAANEINRAAQRIRDIYQHTFMEDQTEVMTGHGTHAYDVEAYDNHEDDARRWNRLLLHHMDGCWQDDAQEANVLKFYESLPHIGIFEKKDYKHFTPIR